MKYAIVLAAAVALVAGCDNSAKPTTSTTTSTTTTSSTPPAATPPAATPSAATTTTTTTTTTAALPAECNDYINRVDACVTKMGAAGSQFKQAMDTARSQWAGSGMNSADMAKVCKQADDQFKQAASAMKC